jgi:Zn-dependent protease
MSISWKLGRVAGIDLYLHPTFLLLLLLPEVRAGGVLTILYMVALFTCVVLHEFGHALMARRFGIETEDITLYPIGGVARLKRMPRAPGAELLIALAGPAVNFVIVAALLIVGAVGINSLDINSPFMEFVDTMIVMNVVLALFNLIPAFPMDGGRVLRALLSGWLGRSKATMIAARVGRTLAVLFALAGIFYTHNFVHVFVGAFIFFAALMEERHVVLEERRRAFGTENASAWDPPAGYRWVNRGDGIWFLAPILVRPTREHKPASWV